MWDNEKSQNEEAKQVAEEPEVKAAEVEEVAEAKPQSDEDGGDKQAVAESEASEEPSAEGGSDSEEPMVPRAVLGKVAKSIREKARNDLSAKDQELERLKAEVEQLKQNTQPVQSQDVWSDDSVQEQAPSQEDIQKAAREAARVEFLTRQEMYGRQKYGADYDNALEIVRQQNDPVLVRKIMDAPNPADLLVTEAVRIAEEMQYGSDPVEREQKKQEALKSKWRKEWEAEMATKVSARRNQPTDVGNVRAAGGNDEPKFQQETWETPHK